jgi:succinate dehydrogenase / fumarate reductase cytochrome b subunit
MTSAEPTPTGPASAQPKARPLSPHLQIYKPQLTSMLSITHRITGVGLVVGSLVFVAWLACLASGPESYNNFAACFRPWYGQVFLIGLSFCYFFHLCTGIRHLFWDCGLFLDLPGVYKTGRIAIGVSLLVTLLTWLQIYGVSL